MMSRQPRRAAGLIPLLLALSACGPRVPLDLSMRQTSVDIGGLQPPPLVLPPAPLPGPNPALPTPTVLLPPPFLAPTNFASVDLCPKARQFAVPEKVAEPVAPAPAAAASYIYLAKGSLQSATFGGGAFPPLEGRKVQRGSAGSGYDFSVTETTIYTHTTNYTLVQPSNAAGATPGGLYIVGMQWKDLLFGDLTFAPVTPVQFLPLPAQQSTTPYASAGADPINHTSMSLQGQIIGKQRVDACGHVIDTWEAAITERIVNAAGAILTIEGTYDIATQYGGLVVQDHTAISGENASSTAGALLQASTDLTATITSLPQDVGN